MSEIINYCLKSPKQYLNRYMQSFMILGPAFETEGGSFAPTPSTKKRVEACFDDTKINNFGQSK